MWGGQIGTMQREEMQTDKHFDVSQKEKDKLEVHWIQIFIWIGTKLHTQKMTTEIWWKWNVPDLMKFPTGSPDMSHSQ